MKGYLLLYICVLFFFFFLDVDMGQELRKRSLKRKDSTAYNKIILRQPRLHFQPQAEILAKAKQSTLNNSNNASLIATNLCKYMRVF